MSRRIDSAKAVCPYEATVINAAPRVAAWRAAATIDQYETVPVTPDLLTHLQTKNATPAEIISYCDYQIDLAQKLIDDGGGGATQIEFWEPLIEALDASEKLAKPFLSHVRQKIIDCYLEGIWSLENRMEDNIVGDDPYPTQYAVLHDSYENALAQYQEHIEPITQGEIAFPVHSLRAAYDQIFHKMMMWEFPINTDDWKDMQEMGRMVGVDSAAMKDTARGARERVLVATVSGDKYYSRETVESEARYFGIILPPQEEVTSHRADQMTADAFQQIFQEPFDLAVFIESLSFLLKIGGAAQELKERIPPDSPLGRKFAEVILATTDPLISFTDLPKWCAVYQYFAPHLETAASMQERLVTWTRGTWDREWAACTEKYFQPGGKYTPWMIDWFFDSVAKNFIQSQQLLGLSSGQLLSATQQEVFKHDILKIAESLPLPGSEYNITQLLEDFGPMRELFPADDAIERDLAKMALDDLGFVATQNRPTSLTTEAPPLTPDVREELVRLGRLYVQQLQSFRTLEAKGFNTVYGPIADVATADGTSYMENAGRVVSHAPVSAGFIAALTQVAADQTNAQLGYVLKHAPGIGAIQRNPEYENIVIDTRSLAQIENDFASFTTAYSLHPERTAVMVSGVAFPALESDIKDIRPGAFSPDVCDWLRARLGDDVPLFSDDIMRKPFLDYLQSRGVTEHQDVQAILMASQAGIDVCLCYQQTPGALHQILDGLEAATEAGKMTRADLEKSVLRILKYKQAMFPSSPALQDLDALVAKMSIRELWAQKIIFPCWSLSNSREFMAMGVGGLTFEGIKNPVPYSAMVQGILGENPDMIPPLMANNSPQEVGDATSSANSYRTTEISVQREMAQFIEKNCPNGISPADMRSVMDEIMQGD